MARSRDGEDLSSIIDLIAALGEHIVDLERRVAAIEAGEASPKRIAASDLRRVTKALMAVCLRHRQRLRDQITDEAERPHDVDQRA